MGEMTPGTALDRPDANERWRLPGAAVPASANAGSAASQGARRLEPMGAAFAVLLGFVVVYFIQPGQWFPSLAELPLEKMTGALALVAFALSAMGQGGLHLRLPREIIYLMVLFLQLCAAMAFSPVWKGGAFQIVVMEFSKVVLITLLLVVAVTTLARLRNLMLVQALCIVVVTLCYLHAGNKLDGRLMGSPDGRYSNPNDLALLIDLAVPFLIAFALLARSTRKKLLWASLLCIMVYAVVLTYSRGGLLALLAAVGVSLWEFGIKGRRTFLVLLASVGVILLTATALTTRMGERLRSMSSPEEDESAYASRVDREKLFWRSIHITEEHPLFGIGSGNFTVLSGNWHVTHNSYTELSAEGGIPALVLFLLMLWRSFRNLHHARRAASGQPEVLVWIGGIRAALACFLVGACFVSCEYQFLPYFFVAYTSVLYRVSGAEEASRSLEARELPQADAAGKVYA
jgi:O-antigen ligase